jgi:hypothetical protein
MLTITPYVLPNGKPAVAIIIRTGVEGVVQATLDGHPAFATLITEDSGGNAPWNLGDLLVRAWEEAKKLAGK